MAKRLRWGRICVALALCSFVAASLVVTAVPGAFWSSPPPPPSMEELKADRVAMFELQALIVAEPDAALDAALAHWEHSRFPAPAGYFYGLVAAARGQLAAQVVEDALHAPMTSESARLRALPRLRALAKPIDLRSLRRREHELTWSLLGEQLFKGSPWGMLGVLGPLQDSVDFARLDVDLRADRDRADSLAVLVGLQLAAGAGSCPDDLAQIGDTPRAPYTYDPGRCELAVVVHPTRPPMLLRGRR